MVEETSAPTVDGASAEKPAEKKREIKGGLPYSTSPGTFKKALDSIIVVESPDRFTGDFMTTVLKISGGSSRPVPPLLKKAILATFVILLSLIPNFHAVDLQKSQILLSCSIVVSVFIIFTSLLDASSNYYHRGELLHQSARGVAKVYYDSKLLNIASSTFSADLQSVRDSYRKVLEDSPFNHDDIDYKFVRIRRPDLFQRYYGSSGFSFYAKRVVDFALSQFRVYAWLYPHILVMTGVTLVVWKFVF